MKFRLTIDYEVDVGEYYPVDDKERILNTEQWLMSIRGVSRYLLDLCEKGITPGPQSLN